MKKTIYVATVYIGLVLLAPILTISTSLIFDKRSVILDNFFINLLFFIPVVFCLLYGLYIQKRNYGKSTLILPALIAMALTPYLIVKTGMALSYTTLFFSLYPLLCILGIFTGMVLARLVKRV